MSRTPQHGGFSEEAIEKAKAAMLDASDFSEQQEAPARNKDGMPSILGFAEQHFDFKTCQRSDGTFYGTAGDCAQKGSKEVKNEKKALKKRAGEVTKQRNLNNATATAAWTTIAGMLPGAGPAITAMLTASNLLGAATSEEDKKLAKKELEKAKKEAATAIKAAKAEKSKPKAKPVAEKPKAEKPEAKPVAEKPKAPAPQRSASRADLTEIVAAAREYNSMGLTAQQKSYEIDSYARDMAKGSKKAEEQMRKAGYQAAGLRYSPKVNELEAQNARDAEARKAAAARRAYENSPEGRKEAERERQRRAKSRSFWNTVDANKKAGIKWEDL